MILSTDTICAISTPIGVGAIGIVRLSGPKAKYIAEQVWKTRINFRPRYFYHGTIINPQTNELLDDAGLLYFKSPNSFTGEDVIEFHIHSGHYILKTLINILLDLDARLAEKGEFTKRAFLNNKINLTQAEGIQGLIEAKTKKAQLASLDQLQGKLFDLINNLQKKIIILVEHLDASLDFPEEVDPLSKNKIMTTLTDVMAQIMPLINKKDYGRYITTGIKCLIVGKPNVGKSSLLNKLAGEERAIVSAIPGTTRDFIDITIDLNGVLFEFIDTAGLRNTENEIEQLGLAKVETLMNSSDCFIWILDASSKISHEDLLVYEKIKEKKHVYLILNKIDLPKKIDLDFINNHDFNTTIIETSFLNKNDLGLDKLKHLLFDNFLIKFIDQGNNLICNIRQIDILNKIAARLNSLLMNLTEITDDLLAEELKIMLQYLGELSGEEISEELINNIFSKFCIGK
ncbi:MAG: tRNA uridine-5-carboxymethylaminomethyl(34) synthesis GTPase MnmE [Candidatus Margulisiibacteriota bacterium]|jgi:tRNA modification GTPase